MNEQFNVQGNNPEVLHINKKNKKFKKVLLISIAVILTITIAVFAMIPLLIMNNMVNMHVNHSEIYTPEKYGLTANKLTLTTSDGLKIAASEVETPSPKAIVIFLSGIQNPSVTIFYGHSALLKDNGYASILCELRAHGESDGDMICAGYKEYLDVKAVVDYIKSQDKYKDTPIVIYGLSMGGTVAINSMGQIPEIDGLISMSAFSSWEDVFNDSMENMGVPKIVCTIEKPFVILATGFKYGFNNLQIVPKNEIKKLGNRPALLYHSKGDTQIPYVSFERIMKNATGKIDTWVKEGDNHIPIESFENPKEDKEYSNILINFLDSNFDK